MTNKFLRDDGTFQTVSVTSSSSTVDNTIVVNTTSVLGGTTGNLLYDNAATVGELANLPVSKLNSGTGASTATFWRGDGTWASVAIATSTASSTVLTPKVFINTAGSNETEVVPTLVSMADGAPGTPVTSMSPTVGIARYDTTLDSGEGGTNAALYVQSFGEGSGNVNINGQVNALYVNAKQTGIGDTVGVFSIASNQSTDEVDFRRAFGGFFLAEATNPGHAASCLELSNINGTGIANDVTDLDRSIWCNGINLIGGGTQKSACGIVVAANTPGFDAGLVFSGGCDRFAIYATSDFVTVNGLDLSSATFTGAPILAPLMTPTQNSTGVQGAIKWDASFIYVCTAADTWKRAALSTF